MVLYCIVLHGIVLYCAVINSIVLYCVVLHGIVLCCIALHCIVLYCIVLYCIVLYCIALYCIVLYLVDGGWSSWAPSSPCSASCNRGQMSRSRSCTAPTPEHGGAACVGEDSDLVECIVRPCPGMT